MALKCPEGGSRKAYRISPFYLVAGYGEYFAYGEIFESDQHVRRISQQQRTLEMKPIALLTFRDRRRDSFDRAWGKCRRQPFTDYSYHSGAFEQSSAHYLPVHARSFWNISRDYFKREARYDFWSEAVLFAFITITAALPLINNVHALIEFVRAIVS